MVSLICGILKGDADELFTKQKQTHRDRKQTRLPKGEREREVAQSCPTLCNHMDCSLPGPSVLGIFQAIVLEWIAISFSA